ncbi:anthranilate synthase component I [Myxacorys almedinensis A]|uniref:Anthranilate synthase component 1 n=2 Tax=Myxacorys TaxID=2056239 RepID=A0A8J7Z7L3_9CYAN|nr:anthranilate synthase component I [Myxacorys almedinensis A]
MGNDALLPLPSLASWHWRSQPLNHRTGSQVFAALFLDHPIATLLESPYPASPDHPQLGRYSICAGSPRWVDHQPQLWTPKIGEVLPLLNRLLQRSRGDWQSQPCSHELDSHELDSHELDSQIASLPFTGGWLGWLGYDVAREIERLPCVTSDPLPFAIAYWYEPDCFTVLDHEQQLLWLAATQPDQLDKLEQQLTTEPVVERGSTVEFSSPTPQFQMSQAEYQAIVLKAKQHIQAGDIFQANLSLRFEVETRAESWSIYRSLQQINPSPFASYWKTPWGTVISCSPERLVQVRDGVAQTRPIAGTRSRGHTFYHDQQLAAELLSNTKERAEHIMLVDLERNDLGRVCEWGSVVADELLTIERYSHVMHLVSNVKGVLRSDVNAVDLIRALFPGGTITGCPKVRCMEIIEALEPVRRNLFYGSCGYLDRRGYLDLNILIRTLLYSRPSPAAPAKVWGQVGAGIVADSDPHREWQESLHKAQAQLKALEVAMSSWSVRSH